MILRWRALKGYRFSYPSFRMVEPIHDTSDDAKCIFLDDDMIEFFKFYYNCTDYIDLFPPYYEI